MVKKLYPFKSNFLKIDDINFHYLDEGRGNPVIMLHGNPTWSFYFRELIMALRDSYRVIVPDHIGCGLSDKPNDGTYNYTLNQRVNDLEALLEHLKITSNITLILHDWGGMIGMAYAVKYPKKINKFIIMNTSAFHLPKSKKLPWQLWVCRNTALGDFLVRGLNAFCIGTVNTACKKEKMPEKIRDAYLAPYNSWANRIAVLRFVQDIPLKSSDPAYSLVSEIENNLVKFKNMPFLILWGEMDFVFDHHFLKVWKQNFPDAEIHCFPDAGHYILEDEKEKIIPLVKDFLKRNEKWLTAIL